MDWSWRSESMFNYQVPAIRLSYQKLHIRRTFISSMAVLMFVNDGFYNNVNRPIFYLFIIVNCVGIKHNSGKSYHIQEAMDDVIDGIHIQKDLEYGLSGGKTHPNSLFYKFTKIISLSSSCNCFWTLTSLIFLMFVMYVCKTYVKAFLLWISYQDPVLVNSLFILLFTLVSFPFLWGYMLLVLSSGYLFGVTHGLTTVIVSANTGVAIAHYTIKSFHSKYPICRLNESENAQAVLRVISGSQAFKIVMFCRLSPIPFGLQNTVFALSNVPPKTFHVATFFGLLPAQCLATYLGSTLRSMEDVLSDHTKATTGFVVLSIQIVFGLTLLVYVIHKARQELKSALILQNINSPSKDSAPTITVS